MTETPLEDEDVAPLVAGPSMEAALRRGWWKHLVCRIAGHQFYWLDFKHQDHCIRCGSPA